VRDAEQFANYGLRGLGPGVDFSGVLLSTRRVVEEVHDKIRLRDWLEAAGVKVIDGAGDIRFADPHTVRLENGGLGGTEAEIRGHRFWKNLSQRQPTSRIWTAHEAATSPSTWMMLLSCLLWQNPSSGWTRR
jgi:hypothetical protein